MYKINPNLNVNTRFGFYFLHEIIEKNIQFEYDKLISIRIVYWGSVCRNKLKI